MKKISCRTQKGFTIIEILVVIVVIGILAAIVTVAYNGVQTRAENTKTINAIGGYAKALQIYYSDNSAFPTQGIVPCLDVANARCANMDDATAACNGSTTTLGFQVFVDAMKTVVTTLPALSTQKMNCGGKMYSGGFYYSPDKMTAYLYYYLRGITSCSPPGSVNLVSTFQNSDTTLCTTSVSTT